MISSLGSAWSVHTNVSQSLRLVFLRKHILCRNGIFFFKQDINRQQVLWFAVAFLITGVDIFDIELFATVSLFDSAAFLNHSDNIHVSEFNGYDLGRIWKSALRQNIVCSCSGRDSRIMKCEHCLRHFALCKGSFVKVLNLPDYVGFYRGKQVLTGIRVLPLLQLSVSIR